MCATLQREVALRARACSANRPRGREPLRRTTLKCMHTTTRRAKRPPVHGSAAETALEGVNRSPPQGLFPLQARARTRVLHARIRKPCTNGVFRAEAHALKATFRCTVAQSGPMCTARHFRFTPSRAVCAAENRSQPSSAGIYAFRRSGSCPPRSYPWVAIQATPAPRAPVVFARDRTRRLHRHPTVVQLRTSHTPRANAHRIGGAPCPRSRRS